MSSTSIVKNGLSAFTLKVLACVFMLIDHVGVIFFPQVEILRIIGRLSYPLFAYFIAEGCRYTKNKLKRFLSVFLLGLACEVAYIVVFNNYYGGILLTFSVSIVLIYLLDYCKKSFLKSVIKGVFALAIFAASLAATYFYCENMRLDYGFFGVLAPVFAVLFDDMGSFSDKLYSRIDRKVVSLSMFAVGLMLIIVVEKLMPCQIYSMFSLCFLVLYNGTKGRYSFKYGFYLFYPMHLIVLQGINLLTRYLGWQ